MQRSAAPTALYRVARILVGLQLCALLFVAAGSHGAFAPLAGPPTTTDFASFYTAGRLANQGRAPLAYDPAAHGRVEDSIVGAGAEEKRFLNPPVFLLVCAPLARLPYLPAFVLFEAVTCLAWLWLGTLIAGSTGWNTRTGRTAGMALAAIPAVWWALGWGQNSFLSAGLMAAGTLLLADAPFAAGLAFGALCFKPHFGVLLPVALLAGRQWRAMTGAALSAIALTGASAVIFGIRSWQAWLTMLAHARATVETGIALSGHIDLAGAVRLAGGGAFLGWALQAGATLGAAACVAWAWLPARRACRLEASRAVLVAATLVAMPFLLFYDLVMAGVAAAWIVRATVASGHDPDTEARWLILAMLLSLLAYPAAGLLHVAIGTLAAPLLLWRALRLASLSA